MKCPNPTGYVRCLVLNRRLSAMAGKEVLMFEFSYIRYIRYKSIPFTLMGAVK